MIATADCGCACRELVKWSRDVAAEHKGARHAHHKQKQADHHHPFYKTMDRLEHHLIGKLDQNQPRRTNDRTRQGKHRCAIAIVR